MSDFKVVTYSDKNHKIWNHFVQTSKNGTFLCHRDFMEYHQDRFKDQSFLIFKDKKLVALFPANIKNHIIYSHQGLTYGGLIVGKNATFKTIMKVFKSLLETIENLGFEELIIKPTPRIYHTHPSDEVDYLLFKLQAELIRKDLTLVIDTKDPIKISSSNRKRGLKKAHKNNLIIKEESDLDLFWNQILKPNLKEKHGVEPVHTLEEINYLKSKFPNNIRQFNVYNDNNIVAGTTIFETEKVAHAQYISANHTKQELGSLDLLFHHLIHDVYESKPYFDFGICSENGGKQINSGLQSWKESFGARSISHDVYSVLAKNHVNLNDILI
ncbi:GNAT family N-acetyltransferase [Xanthomarina sp. F2636L]|uniref:GNAT family N-acetyltransferase n=1 Tax=Xanthomarina sp. F2636L TaxID=2996018 RepID=UPI00225E3A43|nr:GNAT family N-acetyltransferase [Xanthomarina sp. F2636L]MCX7550549.1 GNAT family N-acetyltransferase [Xanthomarina sp. F2636L]